MRVVCSIFTKITYQNVVQKCVEVHSKMTCHCLLILMSFQTFLSGTQNIILHWIKWTKTETFV